ncbi:MAG: 1-deoxy-D-xylulose-5-phosphate synthase, partial [Campylobacterota bacterium]
MTGIDNIKEYSHEELDELSTAIREKILQTVSKNGGHLSSTLGATDLIIAMHYVFNPGNDPFIFDVSHQCYAHKLLTGRWNEFDSLRQLGGLSGYTKPGESEYDYYVAGHSSTSISLAVGAAKAIELKGQERIPVALIGDGAMSAGMVYEALNELGDRKYPVVIVLNDNEMSIAKPIGAISKYLSQKMAGSLYQKLKRATERVLEHMPEGATYMAKRFEESLKLITPGILFEEMGIEYIGPTDGHDIKNLIETFEVAKQLRRPVIVHTQTLKGKGYEIAEGQHEKWHGVGAFDISSGESFKKKSAPSATALFSQNLLALAKANEKIVGVTAAMPSGTGMDALIEYDPKRFWDVAIAEQHAVTSMGALAKEGFVPYVVLYSTFLQRGYDQIIHDICLMDLPVTFAIDRAGIVGEDGETHQGAFDISYLRPLPNMHIAAPFSEQSMQMLMEFSASFEHPLALRYPRGAFANQEEFDLPAYEVGKAHLLQEGRGILFIAYGNAVGKALEVSKAFESVSVLDLRFVKPLDEAMLCKLAATHEHWFVFSDGAKIGGVSSAVSECIVKNRLNVKLESFEYEDAFIQHGKTPEVEK